MRRNLAAFVSIWMCLGTLCSLVLWPHSPVKLAEVEWQPITIHSARCDQYRSSYDLVLNEGNLDKRQAEEHWIRLDNPLLCIDPMLFREIRGENAEVATVRGRSLGLRIDGREFVDPVTEITRLNRRTPSILAFLFFSVLAVVFWVGGKVYIKNNARKSH